MHDLIKTFEDEIRKNISQIQTFLLNIEKNKLSQQLYFEKLREAFRSAHSMKGAARVVGIVEIEKSSHTLESLLKVAVTEKRMLTNEEIDTCFQLTDHILECLKEFLGVSSEKQPGDSRTNFEIPMSTIFQKQESLRVPTDSIEQLLHRVEEAFLVQSELDAMLKHLKAQINLTKSIDTFFPIWELSYRNKLLHLHRIILEFHKIIRSFRMLPIKMLALPLEKTVRDVSRSLGKKVEFRFECDEIYMDASKLEFLLEPFIHIIRNAISHGIEPPEERKEKNKPEIGSIIFSGFQKGTEIEFRLSDDGRGIDHKKIVEWAILKNLITEKQANDLKPKDIINLIFEEGFSTSPEVSYISGRGLGLSLVRKRVNQLGGTLALETYVDQGTTCIIRIPIGVIIPRVLIVRCGQYLAAIPVQMVEKVLLYHPSRIKSIQNSMVYVDDQDKIPVVPLAGYLKWPWNRQDRGFIIVVRAQNEKKGLLVDIIEEEMEHIAFPPPTNMKSIRYVSGIIVSGNGQVIPVLDMNELLKQDNAYFEPLAGVEQLLVLVVDDSPTFLALHRSILQKSGYRVITADNGKEAWEKLQKEKPHLIITDIEMPEWDGIMFIEKIKSHKEYRDIPIIVVSQYGKDEDLQKAADAGADRYIVKSALKPEELIKTIRDLSGN